MVMRLNIIWFLAVMAGFASGTTLGQAQNVTQMGTPTILAEEVVATAHQRHEAGKLAEPPINDRANGFAWPDTPIGVIKRGDGYAFFGSDGAMHHRQFWQGKWYGNNKYGSATCTFGTLDNPLSFEAPMDVTISPNARGSVNPSYGKYDYMGGGPVYQVPEGRTGAGKLLMVYHAELPTRPTATTQSFYSQLGLAASADGGASWEDLGEIIRVNQAYRGDLDGFDIGDPPLAISPDGKYFYIYFRDWQANGTRDPGGTVTLVSVARASIAEVLQAAFGGGNPHAAAFYKYFAGGWTEPGIGGRSTDLNPEAQYSGECQVAWSSALGRYVMIIGEGVLVAYAESPDGLNWSLPVVLKDFRGEPDQPNIYVAPVGEGDDPMILGAEFYIYYTNYPTNGEGWAGATLKRLTVEDE